jgi:hypothetical protein
VSYKKQELFILLEHLSSPLVFGGVRIAHLFSFLCWPIVCLYVQSSVLWYRYEFRIKRCSVRLYLRLFVGEQISYLRYLCLFMCSGVQHILCCVFALFVFVLCTICCQFLWIVLFWWPLLVFSNVYLLSTGILYLRFHDIRGHVCFIGNS